MRLTDNHHGVSFRAAGKALPTALGQFNQSAVETIPLVPVRRRGTNWLPVKVAGALTLPLAAARAEMHLLSKAGGPGVLRQRQSTLPLSMLLWKNRQ